MATDRNLDAGDGDFYRGDAIPLDSGSNEVGDGELVKFDGEGLITPTTAEDDDYVGVVLPEDKADDEDGVRTVHVAGRVLAVQLASDATASPGDTLIPSGTDDGRFDASESGMSANTGDSDTDLYLNHPFALEDGENDDVILACFR